MNGLGQSILEEGIEEGMKKGIKALIADNLEEQTPRERIIAKLCIQKNGELRPLLTRNIAQDLTCEQQPAF